MGSLTVRVELVPQLESDVANPRRQALFRLPVQSIGGRLSIPLASLEEMKVLCHSGENPIAEAVGQLGDDPFYLSPPCIFYEADDVLSALATYVSLAVRTAPCVPFCSPVATLDVALGAILLMTCKSSLQAVRV